MGFIKQLQQKSSKVFPGQNEGNRLWRQTFGTTKEDPRPKPQASENGGSFGRSTISSHAAVKRLVQALASMAPGGWSDDRYQQTKNYIGLIFLAIESQCRHMRRAQFEVFKRDDKHHDGKRLLTRDDSEYELVERLRQPNEDDSFGDLMVEWTMQLDLTGMALTWKVPSKLSELYGKGPPARLYPIKTATAIPQPAVNPEFPDGFWRIQPVYPYGPFSSYPTPSSAVGAPIPAQQMLRFKYTHPLLRYDGYSPQSGLSSWIDQFNTIDRSRNYSMRGAINPSAVLEQNLDENGGSNPIPEEEIDRIIAEFEQTVGGPENMGRLFVTPNGSTLKEWGATPDKMLYEGGWDQVGSAILGGFGMTKPAAGMVEDSSYSQLFATLKQLYWTTLEPKCEMIAEKLTRHLAPDYGDDLIIEIKCKPIDDHEKNQATFQTALAGKCATKNEGRKLLGLSLTREEWGDDILGDPSPFEKEQAEKQEQQAGAGAPGAAGAEAGGPPAPPPLGGKKPGEKPEEAKPEPPQVAASRPNAGKLSAGALGGSLMEKNPIGGKRFKQLNRGPVKSVYDMVREALKNGNGHG